MAADRSQIHNFVHEKTCPSLTADFADVEALIKPQTYHLMELSAVAEARSLASQTSEWDGHDFRNFIMYANLLAFRQDRWRFFNGRHMSVPCIGNASRSPSPPFPVTSPSQDPPALHTLLRIPGAAVRTDCAGERCRRYHSMSDAQLPKELEASQPDIRFHGNTWNEAADSRHQ